MRSLLEFCRRQSSWSHCHLKGNLIEGTLIFIDMAARGLCRRGFAIGITNIWDGLGTCLSRWDWMDAPRGCRAKATMADESNVLPAAGIPCAL